MIKIEVKLYSYHDMDLVALYKTGKIIFPETTKQILNSYARKEVYRVGLLPTNQKRLIRYPSDSYKKFYHYHVYLDEKKDADAIKLLESISEGCRNSFIKVILRQYLCGALLSMYNENGDNQLFKEMSSLFQGDREERLIAHTRSSNPKRKNKKDEVKQKKKEEEKKEQKKEQKKEESAIAESDIDDIDDFLMGVIEQY